METSRRDLSIYINLVVDRFIFKHNQITLCPSFTVVTKTGVGLPKTGISFHCEWVFSFLAGSYRFRISHNPRLLTHYSQGIWSEIELERNWKDFSH